MTVQPEEKGTSHDRARDRTRRARPERTAALRPRALERAPEGARGDAVPDERAPGPRLLGPASGARGGAEGPVAPPRRPVALLLGERHLRGGGGGRDAR